MHEAIPSREALPRIQAVLQAGGSCAVTVTGTSMVPLLRHGKDQVLISPLSRPVRRGDVLFYVRDSGRCILHRAVRVLPGGETDVCGDAQTQLERVVDRQILGVVTRIRRNGREFPVTSPVWQAASRIWMALRPMRPGLLRAAGWIAERKRHK